MNRWLVDVEVDLPAGSLSDVVDAYLTK